MITKTALLFLSSGALLLGSSISGSGSISYFCQAPTQGSLPEQEMKSSAAITDSLVSSCPSGLTLRNDAWAVWSAGYTDLSASVNGRGFPLGVSANDSVAFADMVTVFGSASGFVQVSGLASVRGGSDSPSNAHLVIDLGDPLISSSFLASRGALLITSDSFAKYEHVITDTTSIGSLMRQFTFWVPFTAGTAIPLSGSITAGLSGGTTQNIGAEISYSLALVDAAHNPIGGYIYTDSGTFAPEPDTWALVLSGGALAVLIARRRQRAPRT